MILYSKINNTIVIIFNHSYIFPSYFTLFLKYFFNILFPCLTFFDLPSVFMKRTLQVPTFIIVNLFHSVLCWRPRVIWCTWISLPEEIVRCNIHLLRFTEMVSRNVCRITYFINSEHMLRIHIMCSYKYSVYIIQKILLFESLVKWTESQRHLRVQIFGSWG